MNRNPTQSASVPSLELTRHRSHDYKYLMRCWREVAKAAGLVMTVLTKAGELPVYVLESRGLKNDADGVIYFSAGVHGDEVAGAWGLLEWAGENVERLRNGRYLLFPVMNPNGLVLNTRADHLGRDINRLFHDEEDELIKAWRDRVLPRRYSIALCLHEDYDGQGCYLYELNPGKNPIGREILQDCSEVIPVDGRRSMDGNRARHGWIWRRKIPDMPGRPEALVLCEKGTPITLTFETPSEFSLVDRVKAQKLFIESALKHAGV